MPIIFKLVGYAPDKNIYEIRDTFTGLFNMKLLIDLLIFWEFTLDDINKIKFITDSEQIKSMDQHFEVKESDVRIIFVFSSDADVREKLGRVFMREGSMVQVNNNSTEIKKDNVDSEINQPLPIQEEEIPVLTNEIINEINLKTKNLFQDNDFKKLIEIYINRPELFNTMMQYIQHGTIVKELTSDQPRFSDLDDKQKKHYLELLTCIRKLDLQVSDDVIMAKLLKYSGHLNLTVREILYELA